LGRKHGLVANDEKSIVRQDLVEQQLQDMKSSFIAGVLLNKAEFEKNKKKFLSETLPLQLELLSKFLGKNEWLANKITYVDFIAYELLDLLRQFSPQCLDKWQNLQQIYETF
jgi:glutathione S-transferase